MSENVLIDSITDKKLKSIAEKALNGIRINSDEGIYFYYNADVSLMGFLANAIREKINGNKTFFNRNFHIEPTNKCVFACKFCSYSRLIQDENDVWELSEEDMLQKVRDYNGIPITEVHIVGGVHPKMNLKFFGELLKKIKSIRPEIYIKAFTAVELEYMFRKAKVSTEEGLLYLQSCGLDSLPGGGAEIFHPEIRDEICADKATTEEWLHIHETAHRNGILTNCTMLYGHIAKYEHRIDHMERLRQLQDSTHGFNCFIPLKFRNKDNEMSAIPEATGIEDLKCYAMARIYLDNIPHLKAYWPMIGKSKTQLLLNYGVDDIDGTIDDSTKIYSMAGAEDQHPIMTTEQLVKLIRQSKRAPVERDTLYHVINDFTSEDFVPSDPSAYSN
jgi:aminodeoxyfutalosine synthase